MTAPVEFQPPPDEGEAADSGERPAPPAAGSRRDHVAMSGRRMRPLIIAAVLSVLAFAGEGAVFWQTGMLDGMVAFGAADWAAILAGMFAPVAVIWLVALVFQRTDPLLERRLGIAHSMDKALAPIDHAERRLDMLIEKIRRDMDHVDAAVDLASSRIDNLENRFKEEIAELFSVTADAEAKAATIRETLKDERDALLEMDDILKARIDAADESVASFVSRLETASAAADASSSEAARLLSENAGALEEQAAAAAARVMTAEQALAARLADLDGLSQDLADRSDGMADALSRRTAELESRMKSLESLDAELSDRLEERHRRLSSLAESSETEAARTGDALIRNADLLESRAETAIRQSHETGEAIARQIQDLNRLVAETIETAQGHFSKLANDLSEQSQRADSISHSHAESVLSEVRQAINGFASRLQAFETMTREAGTRLSEEITGFSDQFDGSAANVSARAEKSVDDLTRLARALADQADMVAKSASAAAENMGEAGSRMDERTANLGQVLEEMRHRVDEVTDRLETERSALADISEASAGTVLDAADRFREQSAALSRQAEETGERLALSAQGLGAEIARLDSQGSTAAESLGATLETLRREGSAMMHTLHQTAETISAAQGALAGERESAIEQSAEGARRLLDISQNLEQQVAQLSEAGTETRTHLEDIASGFRTAAGSILEAAQTASEGAQSSSRTFEKSLSSAISKGMREVGHSMDTLNTMFNAEVSELQDQLSGSLDAVLAQLKQAAAEANEESRELSERMAADADRMLERLNSFVGKSEAVEKRLVAASQNEFVRTSSLLVESLQSASVDIGKILDTELPDDAWQRFLSGDRSIFSRRAVRLADRDTRARVAEHYEKNAEFRATVQKFIRDFEAMMELIAGRDHNSTLSVTLISSDMGKLYVLLGQALRKFAD